MVIPVMLKCNGLRTVQDPASVAYDSDDAAVWLSKCSNIDITDSWKPRRRPGFEMVSAQVLSGAWHSLFGGHNDYLVFVEHDALSLFDGSGVRRARNVTPGKRMSATMDHEGRVFHANGVECGYIYQGVAMPWTPPAGWVGPPGSTRSMSPPPGDIHLVAMVGSRICAASGQFLFYSEPFDPFRFVLNEGNIPFKSRVRMVRQVKGGTYVGTSDGVYFLAGDSITKADFILVDDSPVVEGTDCFVDADVLGIEKMTGIGVVVTTERSVVFFSESGEKVDLTDGVVSYPPGATGTAIVIGGRYIVKINTF